MGSSNTTFIYELIDPVTGLCRYVGKADAPKNRLYAHVYNATKQRRFIDHKSNWIYSLAQQGLKPVLNIIDEIPSAEWEFWERQYIALYRMLGLPIANGTDGGDGQSKGYKPKQSTIEKMRIVMLAKGPRPAHVIASMIAGRTGRPISDAHKQAVSNANKGRKASQSTRTKMSETQRLRWAQIKNQSQ